MNFVLSTLHENAVKKTTSELEGLVNNKDQCFNSLFDDDKLEGVQRLNRYQHLHELFLGKSHHFSIEKADESPFQKKCPELIGLRTPDQDFYDLKHFERVSTNKANLSGSDTDLKQVDEIKNFIAHSVVQTELFWRKKIDKFAVKQDVVKMSELRCFLDFQLTSQGGKLTPLQQLAHLENNTIKEYDWTSHWTAKDAKSCNKILKKLNKFKSGEMNLQDLMKFLRHKLRADGGFLMNKELKVEDTRSIEYRGLLDACKRANQEIQDSQETLENKVKLQLLLAACTQSTELLIAAEATLLKHLIAALADIKSGTAPDKALPKLSLAQEICCGTLLQHAARQAFVPECSVEPETLQIKWVDEAIEIEADSNFASNEQLLKAARTLKEANLIVFIDGIYYLHRQNQQTYTFQSLAKWYLLKPVDFADIQGKEVAPLIRSKETTIHWDLHESLVNHKKILAVDTCNQTKYIFVEMTVPEAGLFDETTEEDQLFVSILLPNLTLKKLRLPDVYVDLKRFTPVSGQFRVLADGCLAAGVYVHGNSFCLAIFSLLPNNSSQNGNEACKLIRTLPVVNPDSNSAEIPLYIANDEYLSFVQLDANNVLKVRRFKLHYPNLTNHVVLSQTLCEQSALNKFRKQAQEGGKHLPELNAMQWLALLNAHLDRFDELENATFEPLYIDQSVQFYKQAIQVCELFIICLNEMKESSLTFMQDSGIDRAASMFLDVLYSHLKQLKVIQDVKLAEFLNDGEQLQLFENVYKLYRLLGVVTKFDVVVNYELLEELQTISKVTQNKLFAIISAQRGPCNKTDEQRNTDQKYQPHDLSGAAKLVEAWYFEVDHRASVGVSDSQLQQWGSRRLTEKLSNFRHLNVAFHDTPHSKPTSSVAAKTNDRDGSKPQVGRSWEGKNWQSAPALLLSPNALEVLNNGIKNCTEWEVYSILALAIGQLASKMLLPTPNVAFDRESDQIVQSSLLSGGIDKANLHLFSTDALDEILKLCEISSDKGLTDAFESALKIHESNSTFDQDNTDLDSQTYTLIIQPGLDKTCEAIIGYLHDLLTKKRAFLKSLTQEGGTLVTRAAFAIMVKFTGLQPAFAELQEKVQMELFMAADEHELATRLPEAMKDQENIERFEHLWEIANKMRVWLAEKKQILMERTENQRKQQTDLKTEDKNNDEEVVAAKITEIVSKIVEKAKFLVKLKTPDIFLHGKDKDLSHLPHLVKQPTYMAEQTGAEQDPNRKEDWREKVQTWKQEMQERNQLMTKQEAEDSGVSTGVSQVIALLQLPVTVDLIKAKVEFNVINAVRRYAGLQLIDQALSIELPHHSVRVTLLSFFCQLQKDQRELSHYLDDIKGCGTAIEQKIRNVFFSIISKFLKLYKQDNTQDVFLQCLNWNFLSRDFRHLFHSAEVFKLFLNLDLLCDGSKESQGRFTKMCGTFQDLFLSVLSRITRDDNDQAFDQSFSQQLVRAKSTVDEDSSVLLLSQAFNEIFRLFDWLVKHKDGDRQKDDNAVTKKSPKLDDENEEEKPPEDEAVNIEIRSIGNWDVKDDEEESKSQTSSKKGQKPNDKQPEQLLFIDQFLFLTHTFTNVAPKVPRVLNMLHKVVANPFHLQTLFELMVSVDPNCQIKVVRVIQSLLATKLPLVVFDEALVASSHPRITAILSQKADLVFQDLLDKCDKSGRVLVKFLFGYAFALRHSAEQTKVAGNYNLSAFLLRTVKRVFQQHDGELLNEFESALLAVEKCTAAELGLLFEILDAAAFWPTEGAKVRLIRQHQQMHMSYDQLFEVVPSAAPATKKSRVAGVTLYDSERERIVNYKQSQLMHADVNEIVPKLHDQVFRHLQLVLVKTPSHALQCYILKLFLQHTERIKGDFQALMPFLKSHMFEGNTEIANDVYRLGWETYCFYQPVLFEGAIALRQQTESDCVKSKIYAPIKKKSKLQRSLITYKDNQPITRISDGPDTELKDLEQPPVSSGRRTLIKNYFRVAKLAKKQAKERKQLYRDSADLWLLFSKIGFMLYEKNQRFESTNVSVPIKVVYGLLSFQGNELKRDQSARKTFLQILKSAFPKNTKSFLSVKKDFILFHLSGVLKSVLQKETCDEDVMRKVSSVDFSEVDAVFGEMLAECEQRITFFAKDILRSDFNARSHYQYYSQIKKSKFPKAISQLLQKTKKKFGATDVLFDISLFQINLERLLASTLSSALLFALYEPKDDPEFDASTLDKLAMHYHFLKKNKNVNMLEFTWSQKPKNYCSSRYHAVMLQALSARPELVTSLIEKHQAITRTYLFEACISSNAMVQAQVFCHYFIGIARLVAAEQALFDKYAGVYFELLFKMVVVLTFQANVANHDNDEEFSNYSNTLARKCLQTAMVIALKFKADAIRFASIIQQILLSCDIKMLVDRIWNKAGSFDQYRKSKLNIFGFLILEILQVLKDAASAANVVDVCSWKMADVLDTYSTVKLLFNEKQHSFSLVNQLQEALKKKKEQDPQIAEIETDGWTKIDPQGHDSLQISLVHTEVDEWQCSRKFLNSCVTVSQTPEITDKCKFYKIQTEDHKKDIKIHTGGKEVYIKHLKDEKFIWVGSFEKKKHEDEVKQYAYLSQSELGAEIEQIINIDNADQDYSGSILLADKGRKLFYAQTSWRETSDNVCELGYVEIDLPRVCWMDRVKWVSRHHDKFSAYIEWAQRDGLQDYYGLVYGANFYVTVLMESGKLFILCKEQYTHYRAGKNDKKKSRFQWRQFPDLPDGELANQVDTDGERVLIVTKTGKLFTFYSKSALSGPDRAKYERCMLIQKFKDSSFKLRDGSSITHVNSAWLHSVVDDGKTLHATIISCMTTKGPAICSSGDRQIIGRPVSSAQPANKFNILDYDNSKTVFQHMGVGNGYAVGIDQDGEVWVLCGKIDEQFKRYFESLEQLAARCSQQPINFESPEQWSNNVTKPMKMTVMTWRSSQAYELCFKSNQPYILGVDSYHQKFKFFLQKSMVAEHGDIVWPWLPSNEEVLDISTIQPNNTQHRRAWMLLKNRENPAQVQMKYTLPQRKGIQLDADAEGKTYSDKSRTLMKQLIDSNQFRGRFKDDYYDSSIVTNANIVGFFQRIKEVKDETGVADDVVKEIVELRQNYFKVYAFLFDILALARVASDDIYYNRQVQPYQVPAELLADWDVSQKMVDLYNKALGEFSNGTIAKFLLYASLQNHEPQNFIDSYQPTVILDRLVADVFKAKGIQERPNEFKTIFSQLFNKLPVRNFVTQNAQSFRVQLRRENAYDAGGPRRDVLSNICSELMSPALSVLIPTGNNLANYGDFTSCYTLNPNASSQLELKRIQYFGALLGWSINCRQGLGLDLAPHIWKRLANGVDVEMTLDDLNKVDAKQFEMLNYMLKCKDMGEDVFSQCYPDSYMESDFGFGKVVELVAGGSTIKLVRDNVDQYITAFVDKYFQQDKLQFNALYRGVEAACGKFLLEVLTPEMAEGRACSSKQISWQAMKRQMKFDLDQKQQDDFIWCLKQMNNSERQNLLKFFSGATRLIPNATYYINRQYADEGSFDSESGQHRYRQDAYFPEGHTCGFTIDITNYSKKEIMLSQLRKAIALCGEIDADGQNSNEDSGESRHDSVGSWTDFGEDDDGEQSERSDGENDGSNDDESRDNDGEGEGDDDGEVDSYGGEGEENGSSGSHSSRSEQSGESSDSESSSSSRRNSIIQDEIVVEIALEEEKSAGGAQSNNSWESVEEGSANDSEESGEQMYGGEESQSDDESDEGSQDSIKQASVDPATVNNESEAKIEEPKPVEAEMEANDAKEEEAPKLQTVVKLPGIKTSLSVFKP